MSAKKWSPIADLPLDWKKLARSDLNSLASIWKERSKQLKDSGSFKDFNARLAREWAIETGIIEKVYSIDRGITRLLIEKGIQESLIPYGTTDKPAADIVKILNDHQQALEGIFDFVSHKRELSTSYIKQLHQCLTRHQETCDAIDSLGRLVQVRLLNGEWKKSPNNPTRPQNGGHVHEYCPPEHVAAEMDRLITLHKQHESIDVPPEVEAAWLHHRFTQIHPFQDGNGRVARSLASLVLLQEGWFPLVISGDSEQKSRYITACEKADDGDLYSLVELIAQAQRKAFIRSLSLSQDVLATGVIHEDDPEKLLISAAKERLVARKREQIEDLQKKLFNISAALEKQAQDRFSALATELKKEFHPIDEDFTARVERSKPDNAFWFEGQVIEVARQLGYYADTRTYKSWIVLRIRLERQAEIVISFHSLGFEFVGVMAASAFIAYRDKQKKEKTDGGVSTPNALSEDCFQFSYSEKEASVAERFKQWLNEVVLLGLDHWRRQV